jgi:hypothetical protein
LLERRDLHQPRSSEDLALHRFALGVARESAAGSVLELVVALEALLLPYDRDTRHSDLSYRFRVHGAYYLSTDPSKRLDTAVKMKNLYELRSQLVHGGKYPDAMKIQRAREDGLELARRAFAEPFTRASRHPRNSTRWFLGRNHSTKHLSLIAENRSRSVARIESHRVPPVSSPI